MITWITGVEAIKRHIRAAYGRLVAVKVRGRRLVLRPIGCTLALSVTHNAAILAVCGSWGYISVTSFSLSLGPLHRAINQISSQNDLLCVGWDVKP